MLRKTRNSNKTKEDGGKLEERLIRVRRVFTVVKGGRRIGFNA